MTTLKTIDAEIEDLGTHVELCAQRYQDLDARLIKVESKIDEIKIRVESLHTDLWRVLIGTIGTVLVSVISSFAVIYTHIK